MRRDPLLHQLVSRAAVKWPGNRALIDAQDGCSISYKKLEERINGFCGYLSGMGLKKGGRVGLLARNSIEGVIAFFAVMKAGGIAVILNHELGPSDLAAQAKNCGLWALYAGEGFIQKAKDISAAVRSVRFVIETADYPGRACKKAGIRETDPAVVIYTSGTTRRPLGAVLSHRNLVSNSISIVKYAGISFGDRICCVLPFHYIYGLSLLLSHFLAGAAVIIENRFAYPAVVLDTIDKYDATAFAGVSGHYAILLHKAGLNKRRLPTIRYFMQAGDAMPAGITKAILKAFPRKKLYLMYGLTEASPRLTYLDPKLTSRKPSSVGKAVSGVIVKVVGPRGKECRPGEVGEIIASGDNIMAGYWLNRRRTAGTIKKGWLFTGDEGFKDKDGDLFIVGRKDKVVKYSKILKSIPGGAIW